MHGVITAAVRGEQPDIGGAIEQRNRGIAREARRARDMTRHIRVPHETQHVDVDESLKQMQQRQLRALGLGEGMLESIRQRCAQRAVASLARLVVECRFSGLEAPHEILDLRLRLQSVAQGLPDENGDGHRIAARELQQRHPVLHVPEPPAVLFSEGASQLHALLHRHRGHLDPRGHVAEPLPFLAP